MGLNEQTVIDQSINQQTAYTCHLVCFYQPPLHGSGTSTFTGSSDQSDHSRKWPTHHLLLSDSRVTQQEAERSIQDVDHPNEHHEAGKPHRLDQSAPCGRTWSNSSNFTFHPLNTVYVLLSTVGVCVHVTNCKPHAERHIGDSIDAAIDRGVTDVHKVTHDGHHGGVDHT